MSDLSYIEKLLDGAEVEWKELWQVTIWDKKFNAVERDKQPRVIKYHYFLAKDLKSLAIENGNVKLLTTNLSNLWTSEELAGEKVSEGEVIAIPWGGNPVVQYYKGKFLTTDNRIATSADTDLLNNKFLYYYLVSQIDLISSFYRGSGIKHPSMNDVLHVSIPIPPIHIQTEIVRILDTFTELTVELTVELTARQQQYEYYRDQLLTFNDNEIELKTLNEVCSSISAGGDLPESFVKGQTNPTDEFPYPIYANATGDKGLYGFTDEYKVESDAVTIAARGAKVGYHTIREGKFTPIVRLITLVPNKSIILTRYLNYILDMTPIAGTKGGIPQLTVPTVKKISIPVPSLAQQERIVIMLDKFEALTTSRTEGLPREIELRQQQYEYYRDLLLSFPKPEVLEHD